jgi:hypothetical protein
VPAVAIRRVDWQPVLHQSVILHHLLGFRAIEREKEDDDPNAGRH